MADNRGKPQQRLIKNSRMPEGSVFYDRIVPAVLVLLGVVMVVVVVFSIGVLLGLFRLN